MGPTDGGGDGVLSVTRLDRGLGLTRGGVSPADAVGSPAASKVKTTGAEGLLDAPDRGLPGVLSAVPSSNGTKKRQESNVHTDAPIPCMPGGHCSCIGQLQNGDHFTDAQGISWLHPMLSTNTETGSQRQVGFAVIR